MALELGDVRYWMNSGKDMLALSFSGFDPMLTLHYLLGRSAIHALRFDDGRRLRTGEKLQDRPCHVRFLSFRPERRGEHECPCELRRKRNEFDPRNDPDLVRELNRDIGFALLDERCVR
ncbi:MAG: hypothetical protein WA615_25165 [Bradyrhizobium sp.]